MSYFKPDTPYPSEKVGTRYRVVNNTHVESYVSVGDIVELYFNDNSSVPTFIKEGRRTSFWLALYRLEPLYKKDKLVGGKLL